MVRSSQDASVAYPTDSGADVKWGPYAGPILVRGPMTLGAKAICHGYKESDEVRVAFTQ
jgi:hypothetical protein